MAWFCGVLRIVLISRLPERSERTGTRIRVREALALLRDPDMRRYLVGVAWGNGVRVATLPFVIVMLRREVGFSEADVVYTTVATFGGGLASLYLWGRAVDRLGATPIFLWTCSGMAALLFALATAGSSGGVSLVGMVAFFFLHAAFSAGFGVADTHVLFRLTPSHQPSRALVLASVAVGCSAGLTPVLAGFVLEGALAGAGDRLDVYRGFFLLAALLQTLAFLPLRGFSRAWDTARVA